MSGHGRDGFPWSLLASELVGTALLVLVGLSFVILRSRSRSPITSAPLTTGSRSGTRTGWWGRRSSNGLMALERQRTG